MFAHFKKIVSCNSMTRYPQIKEEPFSFGVLENWLMLGRDAPALRPSHLHGCRKRSFGQGHALSGRFAGLDRMTLLSGYGCLRATDEEASAGALSKEISDNLPPDRYSARNLT